MTLDDELKAIEERANKATPGPWMRIVRGEEFPFVCATAPTLRIGTQHDGGVSPFYDLEFIAAARTDVPRLVAALRLATRYLQREREADHRDMNESEWDEQDSAILRTLRGVVDPSPTDDTDELLKYLKLTRVGCMPNTYASEECDRMIALRKSQLMRGEE